MAMGPGRQLPTSDYGQIRAGYADRERALDVLKAAFAEGRLDADEYSERMALAQAARTYADLAALTGDLPAGPLGTLPAWYQPQPGSGDPLPLRPAEPAALARRRATSGLALLSLLCGLASVLWPVVMPAMLALVFGLSALAVTGQGRRRGRALAVAGITLALVGIWQLYHGV